MLRQLLAPFLTHRLSPTRPAPAIRGRRGRMLSAAYDQGALRALVVHLDTHRAEQLSVVARKWASRQTHLNRDWADGAWDRLEAAGVAYKARGTGRENAPFWCLVPLEEALEKLGRPRS